MTEESHQQSTVETPSLTRQSAEILQDGFASKIDILVEKCNLYLELLSNAGIVGGDYTFTDNSADNINKLIAVQDIGGG